jgi:integrase-like protein
MRAVDQLGRLEKQPELLWTPELQELGKGALSTGAGDCHTLPHPARLRALLGSSRKEKSSMARRRYQQGRVYLSGKKKDKWVARFREDVIGIDGTRRRVRKEIILGSKRELPTKRIAQRKMGAALARINGLDYRPGTVATLEELIERWKTDVLTTQKPSSARAVRSHLKCYILPELGKLRLDQFGVESQQPFITRMQERTANKTLSRKTVQNVLGALASILTTARDGPIPAKRYFLNGFICLLVELGAKPDPSKWINFSASSPHRKNRGALCSTSLR